MLNNFFAPHIVQFAWQAASPPSYDAFDRFLREMVSISPVILILLVGFLVALIFWKRSPAASLYLIVALVIFLATDIGIIPIQNMLIQQRLSRAWTDIELQTALSVTYIIVNIIRAGAFILLFMAIFTGRSAPVTKPASTIPIDYNTNRMG